MQNSKTDITTKEDIKLMVDTFYEKVNLDDVLSPIFNDFAKINWETHLPRMYDFWSTILLSDGDYKGSPFDKHVPLPIDKLHFDRWMGIFLGNLEEYFEGPMTEDAKLRAQTISFTFQSKLEYINKNK